MTDTLDARRTHAERLVQLAVSENLESGDFDAYSREICATAASALSVERVGVWMFSDDRRVLRCTCGYRRSERAHDAGLELLAADYPIYFDAIREGRGVAIDDALNDRVTGEFVEGYLVPFGIGALLDVPIRCGGKVVGILCHEHVGGSRAWSQEDRDFGASLADLLALAVEADARRTVSENCHELETQLLHSQKMDALGKLAGGVAHDFNNLLTAILGHAELLQNSVEGDDDAHRNLDEIRRAAERASMLTHQLLTFSRKGTGLKERIDLNDIVRRFEILLRPLLGERITLTSRLTPNLPHVWMEIAQVEHVLMNLGVNARDAMPDGGSIEITTSWMAPQDAAAEVDAPRGWVCLTVRDTGTGIEAQHLPRIFEPFFTTKPAGKGTGLGLATAYGAIKQAGGTIVARNANPGVQFDIRLPASGRARPDDVSRESEGRRAGTETVLLCEDEEIVRDVSARVLSAGGYRVLSAARPAEAIEIAAHHIGTIDLLVTDMVLPEMGGEALAERICGERTDLRVLFTSGYGSARIARSDDVGFLQKPYTPTTFLQKVRDVLDR